MLLWAINLIIKVNDRSLMFIYFQYLLNIKIKNKTFQLPSSSHHQSIKSKSKNCLKKKLCKKTRNKKSIKSVIITE